MKKSSAWAIVPQFIQAAMRAKLLCGSAVVAALAVIGSSQSYGQTNQLINPGLETGDFTGWNTYSAVNWDYAVANVNGGEHSNPGPPNPDVAHSGQYSFFVFGDYQGSGNGYDGMYQDITNVVTATATNNIAAGNVFSADCWVYSYANDYCFQNNNGSSNELWLEISFRDVTKNQILALYRSADWFPAGQWVHLQVTNQFDPNTYALIGTGSNLIAPGGTADVRCQVVFHQVNYSGGSSFWDDMSLNFVSATSPAPVLSAISPSGTTLATNKYLNFTANAASGSTISEIQMTVPTTAFGGTATTTTSYTFTTNSSIVSGLGTAAATVNFPLTSNTVYGVISVTATDNHGTVTHASSRTFDTVSPALVIEASDFNYTTNGNSGQFIDTPANGGLALYRNLVGEQGIDENKNPSAGAQSDKGYYRPSDAVIVGNANPSSMTEQKFVTAAANGDTTDVPEEVGYNSPGDWLDYSRTFGPGGSAPAGTYNVWLYMTTDGGGVQTALSQVTSNPTQSGQTTNFIGTFGTPSFSYSDGSWSAYEYVPLVDQFGNLVSVTLSNGVQTLRSTVVNNPNIGFYILMPATPVLTPALQNIYPDGNHPFEIASNFTCTIGPANGASLVASSIHLILNGVDVTSTSGFTLTQSGASWTINYPLASNAVYSAIVRVTNSASLSSQFTDNFDTFNVNNYQWEAVDYDFSTNNGDVWISGLFIDNPVPTCDITTPGSGEYAANSYFGFPTGFTPGVDPQGYGAIAQQQIDINFGNSGQTAANEYYRADGVGSQPATDYLRPKFAAAQSTFGDPNIGPINIGYYAGGYWMNYTRHWPTNTYNVWARLAGGNGAFSGTTLSLVTNGYGTSSQQTQVLGSFGDPNAAGWQAWHWVPLHDTNGNMVTISLGGQQTLRVTSGGNVNAEFYMLVQAPPEFKVGVALAGGQVNLSIPTLSGYTYIVQYTSSLSPAHWTQVGSSIIGDGAIHVVSETSGGTQGYYQVLAQKN